MGEKAGYLVSTRTGNESLGESDQKHFTAVPMPLTISRLSGSQVTGRRRRRRSWVISETKRRQMTQQGHKTNCGRRSEDSLEQVIQVGSTEACERKTFSGYLPKL